MDFDLNSLHALDDPEEEAEADTSEDYGRDGGTLKDLAPIGLRDGQSKPLSMPLALTPTARCGASTRRAATRASKPDRFWRVSLFALPMTSMPVVTAISGYVEVHVHRDGRNAARLWILTCS
jgi:hypothetical protein